MVFNLKSFPSKIYKPRLFDSKSYGNIKSHSTTNSKHGRKTLLTHLPTGHLHQQFLVVLFPCFPLGTFLRQILSETTHAFKKRFMTDKAWNN